MKAPTLYIDADIILHRAVSFLDDDFDGEPMGDWKTAMKHFDYILNNWLDETFEYEDYHLVLSVGQNFRKGLYPEYKANRKDIVPHPAFAGLKEAVMELDAAVWEEGIEADDLIGIRCSEDPNTVAVSADKDFATVPCTLMIPRSHGRKTPDWHTFTEAEADRNWLIQAMTGDTIDNYPGIPGYGPKKASEVVDNPHTMKLEPQTYFKRGPRKNQPKPRKWIKDQPSDIWSAMVSHAATKGMSTDDMILQCQLARILRAGEYNFDTKEVQLWTPHSTPVRK